MDDNLSAAPPYDVVCDDTDHEAWLKARAALHAEGYVGASTIAAVMGENPYQSPMDAYLDAIGEGSGFTGNTATRRGQAMEPAIIAFANTEMGREIQPFGKLLRSKDHPLAATPDAIEGPTPPMLVQIKDTAQVWDEPPLMYQLQVQAELLVTDWSSGSLLWYDGAKELNERIYHAHEGAQAAIAEAARDFIRRVRELDPPPVDPAWGLDAVKRAFPRSVEKEIDLPAAAAQYDARLAEIKSQLRKLEKEKNEIEAWLRAELKDAARGNLPGGGAYTLRLQKMPERTLEATEYRVLRRVKR